MPARNQDRIRRDINRLRREVARHADTHPALAALRLHVDPAAEAVNARWWAFQQAAIKAARERSERGAALVQVRGWVQRWRPVVLLLVPGTADNTRALLPTGATPDDMIRVADDLRVFIANNAACEPFRADALGEITDLLAHTRVEVAEANAARPVEAAARVAYTKAIWSANEVLVRGTRNLTPDFRKQKAGSRAVKVRYPTLRVPQQGLNPCHQALEGPSRGLTVPWQSLRGHSHSQKGLYRNL